MTTKLFSALAASLLISTAAAAPAAAQTKSTTIALSPYLDAVWSFQVDIGGKARTFLFDTGGGITVVTPETAAEIGCKPWGQLSGYRMRGDRVDMARCNDVTLRSGEVTLKTETAAVFEFSKLLPKDAPPVAGSVALDSFAGKVVTIDIARRQLTIETPASLKRRIAAAKPVELRLADEVSGHALMPFLAVQTPQGKVWMELDSGSDSSVIVASHNAALFGMDPEGKAPQPFRGQLSGGVALTAANARAMPLILDGNIGLGILKTWIVTIDVAHARAWIAPSAPN